jgi:hypothetical protein
MPIQIDAKLNAFRRSSSGFFVTLEIAPDCDWEELARAPLGQAFGVAMVAYDVETGKASPGANSPSHSHTGQQRGEAGKPRKHFHEMSRAQQAGILTNDTKFQLWASAHPIHGYGGPVPDAAEYIRIRCGVTSRAHLDNNLVAARQWDQIVMQFYQDTGRLAEVRG